MQRGLLLQNDNHEDSETRIRFYIIVSVHYPLTNFLTASLITQATLITQHIYNICIHTHNNTDNKGSCIQKKLETAMQQTLSRNVTHFVNKINCPRNMTNFSYHLKWVCFCCLIHNGKFKPVHIVAKSAY